jgi:3-oxoacyl-[acyl-carrier protein] reductase
MAANLHSVFYTCRAAARALREDGRLVLVGSTAGQRGEAYHADYASSKGAMISFVKGFCIELAPRGITVNCVAPGWIDTEMSASAYRGEERESVARAIPIGRIATAEDVAGPIVFLCSALGRHITGEILNINGGAVLVG